MDLTALTAISPIDGRYRVQLAELANFFSEYALIRYRVLVEVEYFISLAGVIPGLKSFLSDDNNVTKLRQLYDVANFTVVEAEKVKAIEKVTNHDVKAVEYYLKEKFDAFCWQEYKEWIHFGLTSQDINNTAIPLSLKVRSEHYAT
jgi:adenylosuccinate lyase